MIIIGERLQAGVGDTFHKKQLIHRGLISQTIIARHESERMRFCPEKNLALLARGPIAT
jgi:hypothetical protein